MKEVLIYREDLKILLNEENNNWALPKVESDDKKEIKTPSDIADHKRQLNTIKNCLKNI